MWKWQEKEEKFELNLQHNHRGGWVSEWERGEEWNDVRGWSRHTARENEKSFLLNLFFPANDFPYLNVNR